MKDNRSLWQKLLNDDPERYDPAIGIAKFYVISLSILMALGELYFP